MITTNNKSYEYHKLIDDFSAASQKHYQFTMTGERQKTNQQANLLNLAAKKILASGEEAINQFVVLLNHKEESVRAMAGAYLLKDRTSLAVETLKPIAKGNGILALGAKMTLERYKKGELEIK